MVWQMWRFAVGRMLISGVVISTLACSSDGESPEPGAPDTPDSVAEDVPRDTVLQDALEDDVGVTDVWVLPDVPFSDTSLSDTPLSDAGFDGAGFDDSGFDSGSDTAPMDTDEPDADESDADESDADESDADESDAGDADEADTPDGADADGDADEPDVEPADVLVLDTAVPDTAVPDTEAPDTAAPDTAAPDTEAPDTAAPDTAAPDTATPDTEAPDTAAPDTEAPDTEAPDVLEPGDVEEPVDAVLDSGSSDVSDDAAEDTSADSTADTAVDDVPDTSVDAGTPCSEDLDCADLEPCGGWACDEGLCELTIIGDDPCDDDNPCTDDDCTPETGCTHAPNDAPCEDGDSCTDGDQCANGSCTAGESVCECTSDAECAALEDGDLCNGTLVCDPATAACVVDPDTIIPLTACDDGDACTTDTCDPGLGCVNQALSTPCDDGDACTTDTCDSQTGCVFTAGALDCDDGVLCTDDACDPKQGCVQLPNTLSCDDGDACTTGDVCAAGSCSGTAVSCDDQNPCTDDVCDPASGCVHTQNTAPCDDGNACTDVGTCTAGACEAPLLDCDDGNPCTDHYCDPETGCQTLPNQAPCDDGAFCTSGDRCSNGACVSGTASPCDGDPQCADVSCDDEADSCTVQPILDGTLCNADTDGCTLNDRCQAGQCVAGSTQACDDGLPCTTDSCESLGAIAYTCQHAPIAGPGGCWSAGEPVVVDASVAAESGGACGFEVAETAPHDLTCTGGGCGKVPCGGDWFALDLPTTPGRTVRATIKIADYRHNCADTLRVEWLLDLERDGSYVSLGEWTGAGSDTWSFPHVTFTASDDVSRLAVKHLNDVCCGCANSCDAACAHPAGDLNLHIDEVTIREVGAGPCLAPGAADPDDACRVCTEAGFGAAPDGTSCDDGDACTADDSCQAGTCGGQTHAAVVGDRHITACPGALDADSARQVCVDRGGELATLTADGAAAVLTLAQSVDAEATWRVGFSDAETEGTFLWADGATSTFTDWCPGEPAEAGETRDCVTVGTACDGGHGWTTEACAVPRPFLCQLADPCLIDSQGSGNPVGDGTCNDSNPCTTDTCTADGCVHTPSPGAVCDDGDGCTSAGLCDGSTCVAPPIDCDDNNPCTADSCAAGECSHTPTTMDAAPCATGQPGVCATGVSMCSASGPVCVPAAAGPIEAVEVPVGMIHRTGGIGPDIVLTSDGSALVNVAHTADGWFIRRFDTSDGIQLIADHVVPGPEIDFHGAVAVIPTAVLQTAGAQTAGAQTAGAPIVYVIGWDDDGLAPVLRLDPNTGEALVVGQLPQTAGARLQTGQIDGDMAWFGASDSGVVRGWPLPLAPGGPGSAAASVTLDNAASPLAVGDGFFYALIPAEPGPDGTMPDATQTLVRYSPSGERLDTLGNVSGITSLVAAADGYLYLAGGFTNTLYRVRITPATAEFCNGFDDDCNGTTDEGCVVAGEICAAPTIIPTPIGAEPQTLNFTANAAFGAGACHPTDGGGDLWFDVTAGCSGRLAVTACPSSGVRFVRNGCTNDETCSPTSCDAAASALVDQGEHLRVAISVPNGPVELAVSCTPECGDGRLDASEGCDDGNTKPGDGCNAQCQTELCGDSVVQKLRLEVCDDGPANDDTTPNACRTDCMPSWCGDGVIDAGEECDDGTANAQTADACRVNCTTAGCGDGVLDTGETCDDGNLDDHDSCTSACVPAQCGDGFLQGDEGCDDGNLSNDDGCSSTCQTETCGDGVTQAGEACDDGPGGSLSCHPDCTLRTCGSAETCGNALDDDCNGFVDDGCPSAASVFVATDAQPKTAALPTNCQSAFDCNDNNTWTTDHCTNSVCTWTYLACDGNDADRCADGRRLTQNGPCVDTGPMLLWDFEDLGSPALVDSSGSQHHGVPIPDATLASTTGRFGQAVQLSEHAVYAAAPMPTTDFTLAVWFKTTQPDGGLMAALAKLTPAGTNADIGDASTPADRELYLSGGQVGYRVSSNATSACSGQGPSVSDGQWHHAAVICRSGYGCRLVVDGTTVCTSHSYDDASHLSGQDRVVAGWTPLGGYFDGALDHVAVFTYPMRDIDLTQHRTDGVLTALAGRNQEDCSGQDLDCNAAVSDSCFDGNRCTLGDTCFGSQCAPGEPALCLVTNTSCHTDVCLPATGECGLAAKPEGSGCDDGRACTANDQCDAAGHCAGTGADCGVSKAWFPVGGDGQPDRQLMIYQLRGVEEPGCILPLDVGGLFGTWKKVQGTTDTWVHKGPAAFGRAVALGNGRYDCVDYIPFLTVDMTIGLDPLTASGKLTLPFPDFGFMGDISQNPPPVHVNAPYLALGIASGAALNYLQAPLEPDRDYWFFSGLLGMELQFPGAPPMILPHSKEVTAIFDPSDPMIYLSLMGSKNVKKGFQGDEVFNVSKAIDIQVGAVGFSLNGQLRHESLIPLWTGEFDGADEPIMKTWVNPAHFFALVRAQLSFFLKRYRMVLTGRMSLSMDPQKDGYDPGQAASAIWNKIFGGDWDSGANDDLDTRLLVDGSLELNFPIWKNGKPLTIQGHNLALPMAIGDASVLIDTTPNAETVAIRGKTRDMPWTKIPVLKDLLSSIDIAMDINGYLKRVGEHTSGGFMMRAKAPIPMLFNRPFSGRIILDSEKGIQLIGTLGLGRVKINPEFDLGTVGPVTADFDGEKFCIQGGIQAPKIAILEDGSEQETTCTINLCIGRNGFDGTTLSCAPFCLSNMECGNGQACIFGVCGDPLPNAAPCTNDSMCASNRCYLGSCVQCWPGSSECSGDTFCDNAGYCQPKLGLGVPCVATAGGSVMRNDWCQSGRCDTVCVECWPRSVAHEPPLSLYWENNCNDGEFCSEVGQCTPLLDGGSFCLSAKQGGIPIDGWCLSGDCGGPGSLCLECGPDTANECAAHEYCLPGHVTCEPRVGDGSVCLVNEACLSNHCAVGVTTSGGAVSYCYSPGSKAYDEGCKVNPECSTGACRATDSKCSCNGNHDHCQGNDWCDALGFCRPQAQNGTTCAQDLECQSGHCAGVCVECTGHDHCAGDHWCAANGSCQPKAADGTSCLTAVECQSGHCAAGVSTGDAGSFCYTPGSKGYDQGCKVNAECNTGACRATDGKCSCNGNHDHCPGNDWCDALGFCRPQAQNGTTCAQNLECQSGHCAGVCVECTSHDHCAGDHWCAANGSCQPKASDGTSCLTATECQSGHCGVGVSTGGTGSFCYSPGSKGYDQGCKVNAECNTGACRAADGKCSCNGSDSHCGSGNWCDAGGYCQPKWGNGHACLSGAECASGNCAGVCVECLSDSHCGNDRYCDAASCKDKWGGGTTCVPGTDHCKESCSWNSEVSCGWDSCCTTAFGACVGCLKCNGGYQCTPH